MTLTKCDRCGYISEDGLNPIIIRSDASHSGYLGCYDLCDECKKGLFEYLKELPKSEVKNSDIYRELSDSEIANIDKIMAVDNF